MKSSKKQILTVNLTVVDSINGDVGGLAVDSSTNRLSSTENLLDGAGKLLGKGLVSHLTSNVDDLFQRNVAVVLDILLFLAVSWGLLEGSDDERGSSRDNRHGSLTVLNSKLDSDTNTLVLLGGLSNVLTDLLGGKTKRTDLGSKSGGSTDFTTGGSQVDDLNLIGVELDAKMVVLVNTMVLEYLMRVLKCLPLVALCIIFLWAAVDIRVL